MVSRLALHQLHLWLGHFRRVGARGEHTLESATRVLASQVTPADVTIGAVPPYEPGLPVVPIAPPVPDTASDTAPLAIPSSAPLEPHHEQGLHFATAHRWNWAQRELERATHAALDGPAAADLASVREVRRQLRILQKWPRDIPALLALGRCYFELGLGADAEATFRHVLTLAPDEPAAPYFLALEYAFRGERGVAEGYYAQACSLAPDLPPFADWA